MAQIFEPSDCWQECIIDDAKEIGRLIGFDIDKIYFSGFWSQGDGACFIGSIGYSKGCAKAVASHAPQDATLHAIATAWQAVQRRNFYRLSANVSHRGRYYHANSVQFDWSYDGEYIASDAIAADCETLEELARDYMQWIYRALQCEYEYSVAWQAATAWQQHISDAASARATARQLVRDMRQARKAGATAAPSICEALRRQLRQQLASAADDLRQAGEIAKDFAYWTQDRRQLSVQEFCAEFV